VGVFILSSWDNLYRVIIGTVYVNKGTMSTKGIAHMVIRAKEMVKEWCAEVGSNVDLTFGDAKPLDEVDVRTTVTDGELYSLTEKVLDRIPGVELPATPMQAAAEVSAEFKNMLGNRAAHISVKAETEARGCTSTIRSFYSKGG
jgi:hypothetical protein